MLHAVAVGSVDDGKSTLIGRLLYETGNLTLAKFVGKSIETRRVVYGGCGDGGGGDLSDGVSWQLG